MAIAADAPTAAAIGVDVGGTKTLAVLVDGSGAVHAEARAPTPDDGDALLDAIAELVAEIRPRTPAIGIGVGAPGLVDASGTLRFAPNLPAVRDLGVRAGLEARVPGSWVRVGNDATCAGWAERVLGAARGHDHVLMVTLGTGIGGGIVAGGRLIEGVNGFAGEFGHMVVDRNGPRCPCGKQGCWERFASGTGLARLGREAAEAGEASRIVSLAGGAIGAVRGEHVTAAAAEGDPEALAVMARFAWWLGLGLANLANIFDPESIVIGGGLIGAEVAFLQPVREAFDDLVEAGPDRPPIAILAAELGERAGAIGAALLAQV